MRHFQKIYNNKINEDKLRGKSEHREELESERGHNIIGVPAGRQAFPWHPSQSTRRQTTQRQTSLPLAPLSEHQETGYTKTDKPSLGTPLGAP